MDIREFDNLDCVHELENPAKSLIQTLNSISRKAQGLAADKDFQDALDVAAYMEKHRKYAKIENASFAIKHYSQAVRGVVDRAPALYLA